MSEDRPIFNDEIDCGAGWELAFQLTTDDGVPEDLTGYSIYCQILTQPGGELLAQPEIVMLTEANVTISLTKAQTLAIGAVSGVYNVLLVEDTNPNYPAVILEGTLTFHPQRTEIPVV